jgi:single-stranded DNA-binding protein
MHAVQLIGRLTAEPESDRTPGGTIVATYRLAEDRPGRESADFLGARRSLLTVMAKRVQFLHSRRAATRSDEAAWSESSTKMADA